MFDVFKNRLEITGILTTVTAIRISSGRSTEPIGADLPVMKDALGRPLIPGSSFKGALRSRLESFLRGIDPKLAANPANEDEWSLKSNDIKAIKTLNFGELLNLREAKQNEKFKNLLIEDLIDQVKTESVLTDDEIDQVKTESVLTDDEIKNLKKQNTIDSVFTEVILQHTDAISLLFGSPWLASKFQLRDLTVFEPEENWFGQYQERDGVAIDRDTETAADGKLYDFQVVPAGTPFKFQAIVENAEEWELGLLMIGLHQFETEQIPLGGARSRGLGVVKLNITEMLWFDSKADPQSLLNYLKGLVNKDKNIYEDATKYRDSWIQHLIKYLQGKISPSSQDLAPTE